MQQVVTHSGKFHADDVLSWGLLQQFYPYSMAITRTRKQAIIDKADIVFDVGGLYDPSLGRFDHHQNEYQGEYSSAGMLLEWLEKESYVSEKITLALRERLVNYVDDVDNGRFETSKLRPCFATIVDLFNRSANSLEEFDQQFIKAASLAKTLIENIILEVEALEKSSTIVEEEMKRTLDSGFNILELPYYLPWKQAYFANQGSSHPTEFVLFPTLEKTWQVVAIPPIEESFAQKRSFPKSWAGLRDSDLTAVTGEESIFCHKNRFIAVFKTKTAALSAMKRFDLLSL
jgi:uncharacterized UPF0160 family protein